LAACSNEGAGVSVDLSGLYQHAAAAGITVTAVTLTVSAADLPAQVHAIDADALEFSLNVPAGAARLFDVRVLGRSDGAESLVYWGTTTRDLATRTTVEGLDITAKPAAFLTGTVATSEGSLPASFSVTLKSDSNTQVFPVVDGKFAGPLSVGTYKVQASLGGLKPLVASVTAEQGRAVSLDLGLAPNGYCDDLRRRDDPLFVQHCPTPCADLDRDLACAGPDDCDDTPVTGAACKAGCQRFHFDRDGDGWGHPAEFVTACRAPTGTVDAAVASDCLDAGTTAQGHAAAAVFQNLEGYDDLDRDGYTVGTAQTRCLGARPAEFPQAKAPGQVDDDCLDAGTTAHGHAAAAVFQNLEGYDDEDEDGHVTGLAAGPSMRCLGERPATFVFPGAGQHADDCAPAAAAKFVLVRAFEDRDGDGFAQVEEDVCSNGVDLPEHFYPGTPEGTDCDDSAYDLRYLVQAFKDDDGDGFTVGEVQSFCRGQNAPPLHYRASRSDEDDCDDGVIERFPRDVDGDGVTACADYIDHGDGGIESLDRQPNRFPGAAELCDGIDNDGDDSVDEGVDVDGDGFEDCASDNCPGLANPGRTDKPTMLTLVVLAQDCAKAEHFFRVDINATSVGEQSASFAEGCVASACANYFQYITFELGGEDFAWAGDGSDEIVVTRATSADAFKLSAINVRLGWPDERFAENCLHDGSGGGCVNPAEVCPATPTCTDCNAFATPVLPPQLDQDWDGLGDACDPDDHDGKGLPFDLCDGEDDSTSCICGSPAASAAVFTDADEDCFPARLGLCTGDTRYFDCDDSDKNIHAHATEDCSDGKDNDCDGVVDAADEDCEGMTCASAHAIYLHASALPLSGGKDKIDNVCRFPESSAPAECGDSDGRSVWARLRLMDYSLELHQFLFCNCSDTAMTLSAFSPSDCGATEDCIANFAGDQCRLFDPGPFLDAEDWLPLVLRYAETCPEPRSELAAGLACRGGPSERLSTLERADAIEEGSAHPKLLYKVVAPGDWARMGLSKDFAEFTSCDELMSEIGD
jgi:hypothetical protein